MQEMWVWSLGRKDGLEEEIATHFSILAWEIPWTEEPGGLQSIRVVKSQTHLSEHAQACVFTADQCSTMRVYQGSVNQCVCVSCSVVSVFPVLWFLFIFLAYFSVGLLIFHISAPRYSLCIGENNFSSLTWVANNFSFVFIFWLLYDTFCPVDVVFIESDLSFFFLYNLWTTSHSDVFVTLQSQRNSPKFSSRTFMVTLFTCHWWIHLQALLYSFADGCPVVPIYLTDGTIFAQ